MMRRGLSLVEVIVSLALLSAVLIFVLNLFPTALATLNRVEDNHDIDMQARGLLEFYSAQPSTLYPVGPARDLPTMEVGSWQVYPTLEVMKYQDSNPKVLVQLRVRLRWKDKGQQRSLVRESLVQRMDR